MKRVAAAVLLPLVWTLPGPQRASGGTVEARIHLGAWAPENLPWKTERVLDRMTGVRATTVMGGVMWMTRARVPGGPVVDDPGGDYAIPMEVAFVRPRGYSRFVADVDRATIASLRSGIAVMPETERHLRGGHERLVLTLNSRRVRVKAVVSNQTTQGHEVLMSRPPPESFRRHYRFVLISKHPDVPRERIRRRIQSLLTEGQHLRLRSESQTTYLRYADQVHPNMVFKKNFGEFSALPSHEGAIPIRRSWVERHITVGRVPILGNVRCHRKLFPQLRGALREVRDRGLAHTIRPDEYAGCFNSRYVATLPGTRISRHTWGLAVDMNVNGNSFGQTPHQDPRLVKIMEKWGFAWGGRWPLPDGMHFEWKTWP
ncbi:MAG: M15 family metallopeptidase [Actinomycetota bacterium]